MSIVFELEKLSNGFLVDFFWNWWELRPRGAGAGDPFWQLKEMGARKQRKKMASETAAIRLS